MIGAGSPLHQVPNIPVFTTRRLRQGASLLEARLPGASNIDAGSLSCTALSSGILLLARMIYTAVCSSLRQANSLPVADLVLGNGIFHVERTSSLVRIRPEGGLGCPARNVRAASGRSLNVNNVNSTTCVSTLSASVHLFNLSQGEESILSAGQHWPLITEKRAVASCKRRTV